MFKIRVCTSKTCISLQELNLEECDEAMLRGDEVDDLSPITTLDQIKGSARMMGHTRFLIALQELVIKKCGGLNVCGRRKDKGYFLLGWVISFMWRKAQSPISKAS